MKLMKPRNFKTTLQFVDFVAELTASGFVRQTLGCGGREDYLYILKSAVACFVDGIGNVFGIADDGNCSLKCLVEETVFVTHADKHAYFAECQLSQTGIVGHVVAAKSYPDDGPFGVLQGVPCGVGVAGRRIVDKREAVDSCHMFHSVGGLVKTRKTVAQRVVAHSA